LNKKRSKLNVDHVYIPYMDGNVEKRKKVVDGAGGDHQPGVHRPAHDPAYQRFIYEIRHYCIHISQGCAQYIVK
jgi:hypothetical protein